MNRTAPVPALLLLAVVVLACQLRQARPPFDYDASLGVAVKQDDRTCLDIRNATLSPGARVRLVTTSTPSTIGEAEVIGRADPACTADAQAQPGLSHYQINVVSGSLENGAPAFAVVGVGGGLTASGTGVTADLDGDGAPESFRSCTSAEGVHLTVWTGSPPGGTRRWHQYFALGYDVDSSCSEAETKPDAQ